MASFHGDALRLTGPQLTRLEVLGTCHRGRVDPRPVLDVLAGAEAEGGLDSLIVTYQSLFERYYGSDAYDLRVGVLLTNLRRR